MLRVTLVLRDPRALKARPAHRATQVRKAPREILELKAQPAHRVTQVRRV